MKKPGEKGGSREEGGMELQWKLGAATRSLNRGCNQERRGAGEQDTGRGASACRGRGYMLPVPKLDLLTAPQTTKTNASCTCLPQVPRT